MGCGRINVLMAMANCDAFTLRFFALLSFWSENHTRTISTEDTVLTEKNFSRSVEAFSQTDVKTNVYKRMLSSWLPWQLNLFSSQTKTFVSEITGRIRAWKQADSRSEDLPLAIQIGQCVLLVGFNGNPGRKRVMGMGRCTTTFVYTTYTPCRDVKFCPNISLGDLSSNSLTEVMWLHHSNGFSNSKKLKKLTRKRSSRNGKWLVWQFCLTPWMK